MNRIGDHALIGDCHSAALVGRDGSIDWACFPRFDSPSVFAAILDQDRGGSFRISGRSCRSVRRAYLPDTNVLVSTFECARGVLEVTDCMPVAPAGGDGPGPRIRTRHSILRRVRCVEGTVEAIVALAPRFEYGALVPRFQQLSRNAALIIGGADALKVDATRPIHARDAQATARWRLAAGEEAWIETSWRPSYETMAVALMPHNSVEDARQRLETTIAFWRDWMAACWYEGEHDAMVRRSALTLKLMQYAPSGAVVAAPTTSLPEEIGGTRNWDYRYAWIRDSTLTLTSLYVLGFTEEADGFKTWLERAGAGRPADLQIMYGVRGERLLPEVELPHLRGHRNSQPVRIGNGAVEQRQLDAYGQIMEAAYLFSKSGGAMTEENWRFLHGVVEVVRARWRLPDNGIWEIRDEPRHFTHSKLNCWVAIDRGVKLARARGFEAPLARWEAERDQIARYLFDQCAPEGWFQQASGHPVPDAATLLVPALGLVPTTHPVALATVGSVRDSLERNGLVYRYLAADGLEGAEGSFLLCSFWLLDCLTHAGRLDEADALLERLLGFTNDVGLLAEQVDPDTYEPLGNFPQAFSHMALVLSCAHLSAAKRGLIPEGAVDYAELAVERLIARGPQRERLQA